MPMLMNLLETLMHSNFKIQNYNERSNVTLVHDSSGGKFEFLKVIWCQRIFRYMDTTFFVGSTFDPKFADMK